jgi:hypothetical protein
VWNGSWENRIDINAADYLGIKNAVGLAVFNNPYENDRAWAIEQGISDGSDPDRPVLRKEVWAMLRRMGRR